MEQWHPNKDDEKMLNEFKGYSQFRANIGDPNWIKWISQLNATFAHIEHKKRQASDTHRGKMTPVTFQSVSLIALLDLKWKNKAEHFLYYNFYSSFILFNPFRHILFPSFRDLFSGNLNDRKNKS